MKTKKSELSILLEGFESAFDLLGTGFKRNYSNNNIHSSWYNTGTFFSKAFEDFKEKEDSNTDHCNRNYHLQE